ncbi:RNA-binding protein [Pseudoflavitalea sp. X16]|jgi:RNA recognition motif-containing protein|uniref:RNA recognition motif domain-containing protein n=1 Tax=Paraflavitalea devenefica TaxID=2716334 RepID=UPI00141D9257|nr:RNA-binding protein [Paraflavitalea devenefica]NII26726.1 RNA-binding protein [Paraflavitalea devenefica]
MHIQVHNLTLNVIDADIRKLFAPFGIVDSAEVIKDKLNGRSKGHALIDMPVEAQARQAIIVLDQSMVDGKKITVREVAYYPER